MLPNNHLPKPPSSGTTPLQRALVTSLPPSLPPFSLPPSLPFSLPSLPPSLPLPPSLSHATYLSLPQDREPFIVPESVQWPRLSDALNCYFHANTGRGLTPPNLDYLGRKLLGVGEWYRMRFTGSPVHELSLFPPPYPPSLFPSSLPLPPSYLPPSYMYLPSSLPPSYLPSPLSPPPSLPPYLPPSFLSPPSLSLPSPIFLSGPEEDLSQSVISRQQLCRVCHTTHMCTAHMP